MEAAEWNMHHDIKSYTKHCSLSISSMTAKWNYIFHNFQALLTFSTAFTEEDKALTHYLVVVESLPFIFFNLLFAESSECFGWWMGSAARSWVHIKSIRGCNFFAQAMSNASCFPPRQTKQTSLFAVEGEEGSAQQLRGDSGVIVKHLVKVALLRRIKASAACWANRMQCNFLTLMIALKVSSSQNSAEHGTLSLLKCVMLVCKSHRCNNPQTVNVICECSR